MKTPKKDKTIALKVHLYTNDIAKEKGDVLPGHAWDCGVVHLNKNDTHGVRGPANGVQFHSMSEILPAIEKVLLAAGVKLVVNSRAAKGLYVKKNGKE